MRYRSINWVSEQQNYIRFVVIPFCWIMPINDIENIKIQLREFFIPSFRQISEEFSMTWRMIVIIERIYAATLNEFFN